MSETLNELSIRTPAYADTTVACASASPTIAVLGDNRSAAVDWCDALLNEGLATRCDTGNGEAADAADALVLHFTQRLAERLGILREWRTADPARPIVVVCQGLRDLEHVLALEMGADDVIDSRASAPVVAARLRALWRRRDPLGCSAPERLTFGDLSLHLRERRVQLGAERVDLTECEFEVLWLLATQAGRAVSRTELLERLRGLPYQRIDRSIDCRIYRIRAKLRDGEGAAQHIRTVRNCGYLFSPARW